MGKSLLAYVLRKRRRSKKNIYNERNTDKGYDDDISDELVSQLVWSVINQGKISNEGKSYCFVTVFKVNGAEYKVIANDKTKSLIFYVRKENSYGTQDRRNI